jgi:Domain of unknown function (DUF222)/HNH endonuclease
MFGTMEWGNASNDQVDQVLGHLFSGRSAFDAEICKWLATVDSRQQFLADGSPDLVQWLSARFGVRHASSAQYVRVSRRLEELPVLASRFASGELTLDQVDAISRMATPETEAALIEESFGLSNAALDRAARRSADRTFEEERSIWDRRRLGLQWNLDASELHLRGNLPGAEGRIVEEAIRDRADRIGTNPETGMFDDCTTRLADGLVEICATSGDRTSPEVQLTVNVDLEALIESASGGVAELEAGPVLANETARRLGCDAIVETAVYDDCRVLGVGRRARLIPGWLRRQLWARDAGCQFPGCGRTRFVHGHHVRHWADGGPTNLDNLILLCGFHHRFLHEHGWSIEWESGGRPVFHRHDGRLYPPPRSRLDDRVRELVRT